MPNRSFRAALLAALPLSLTISAARAQTKTPDKRVNPFAKSPALAAQQAPVNPFAKTPVAGLRGNAEAKTEVANAQFGTIEIDDSRAGFGRELIDIPSLKEQIAALPGALSYREGALGFYRVGFEAVGDRQSGRVRVSVTIVGQSGDRTILATGQSTQRWQNGAFVPQEPPAPREGFGNNSPLRTPAPTDFHAISFSSTFASRMYREFCAPSREEKTGHADGKKARDDAPKREEKRAPNPEPKREEKTESKREEKRAPDPQPKREERPQTARDERPAWERKTKPRDNDAPRPSATPRETSRAPQPSIEPQRAPNPNPSRPTSSVPTRPPVVRAPDPNPSRDNNTSAPDPDPPFSKIVPVKPNRDDDRRDSRRPRAPYWRGPYGYPYPYPYPGPYSYPSPYPYPYLDSYPYPGTYSYPPPLPADSPGAQQAFDYALVAARSAAEIDFDRQLTNVLSR